MGGMSHVIWNSWVRFMIRILSLVTYYLCEIIKKGIAFVVPNNEESVTFYQ